MSTRSYIGNYRGYIYCHWDGYPEHNGEILKKYYKDPKKVDELISLGDISSLAENINPDPSKPHNFDNDQENVVVAYHRDRGEPWEDVKPMVMSKEFEAKDTSIEYIYYFDENRKLWKYKELYANNPKWIWLIDEEDKNSEEKMSNALQKLAQDFIEAVKCRELKGCIDESLENLIKKIKDKDIQKTLMSLFDNDTNGIQQNFIEFQDWVLDYLLHEIETPIIIDYLSKNKLNFDDWDNNMDKLAEYLYFFIQLENAYDEIEQKGLFDEIVDEVLDYLPEIDDVKNHLENPDCSSGGVEKLVGYSDIIDFYEKHIEEINDLIANALLNLDTRDMAQLFGNKWNEYDPLVLTDRNKKLLTWFGYEEIAHRLYTYLFEGED